MSKNNDNKLVPKLRFPEFKNIDSWELKTLQDVSEVYQPKTISQSELKAQGYLVYGANGIIGFYDQYNHETSQIAIACRGSSCGTVNFTEPKSWITGNSMVVNVDGYKDIDKKFMFYQLFAANFNYLITGSGQPQITGNVKNHNVSITKHKEQQKIAACLSSLDEVITAESQKLELLKEHKKGLMQNLFPQEGETVPKLRFKEFEDSGEWEEIILKQVADYENGKAHEQNIEDSGNFIVVNSKFISSDGEVKKFTNTAFCPAQSGDILMVLSDVPNGKAFAKCFFVEEDNLYTVNQRICRITPRNLNSKILYYLLNRNPYFLAFDDGVKQTNLRKEDVLNCPLLIPSDMEEQEKIAQTLSSIDDLINAQNQKIEALKMHKKGLLQGLFPDVNEVDSSNLRSLETDQN